MQTEYTKNSTEEKPSSIIKEEESQKEENKSSEKIPLKNQKHSKSTVCLRKNRQKRNLTYEYGLESTQTLLKNTGNVRYLGMSTFQSHNTFQNSSYMYSFSKDRRFPKLKSVGSDCMYLLPSIRNKRAAGFGIGDRPSVTKIHGKDCPSPDTYKIKTIFDFNVSHKKGPKLLYRFNLPSNNQKIPGPGAYKSNGKELKIDIPVTIKSRNGIYYEQELRERAHCVSMQKYKPLYTLQINTRFKNIGLGIGNRGNFFPTYTKGFPGPGTYNIKGSFETGIHKKSPIN